MKRLYVAFVSAAVFLCALFALAEIQMGDVVRWGLLRRGEVIPGGGSFSFPTSGVLRVVERSYGTDSNAFTVTVSQPFVYPSGGYTLGTGAYSSVQTTVSGNQKTASLTNYWKFVTGRPVWVATFEKLSNTVSGLSFGPTSMPLLGLSYPLVNYDTEATSGTYGRTLVLTNGTAEGTVRFMYTAGTPIAGANWVTSNIPTNAVSFVMQPASASNTGFISVTCRTDLAYIHCDYGIPARYGWLSQSEGPVWPFAVDGGSNAVTYAQRWSSFTNNFVSETLLRDSVDDLRQEISEAIEAHVQLLH